MREKLDTTTGAIDWDIDLYDNYDIPRISLIMDSAPSSAGNVEVYIVPEKDENRKILTASVSGVGVTSLVITDIDAILPGDKIKVQYINPDSVSIQGEVAYIEANC